MALSSGDAPLSWSVACLMSIPEVECQHRETVGGPNVPSPDPKPLHPAWPLSLGLFVHQSKLRGM